MKRLDAISAVIEAAQKKALDDMQAVFGDTDPEEWARTARSAVNPYTATAGDLFNDVYRRSLERIRDVAGQLAKAEVADGNGRAN